MALHPGAALPSATEELTAQIRDAQRSLPCSPEQAFSKQQMSSGWKEAEPSTPPDGAPLPPPPLAAQIPHTSFLESRA